MHGESPFNREKGKLTERRMEWIMQENRGRRKERGPGMEASEAERIRKGEVEKEEKERRKPGEWESSAGGQ